MVAALGKHDANAARELLTRLQQLQPARPEASQALRELSQASSERWQSEYFDRLNIAAWIKQTHRTDFEAA